MPTSPPSSPWIDPVAAAMLTALYGSRAASWLDTLDDLVAELCARWRLVPLGRLAGAGASSVLRVQAYDGRAAVLKLAPPAAHLEEAADAGVAWQATAARRGIAAPFPALLARDDAASAVLLEWVPAGHPGRYTATPSAVELTTVGAMLTLARHTAPGGLGALTLDGLAARAAELAELAELRLEELEAHPDAAGPARPAAALAAARTQCELAVAAHAAASETLDTVPTNALCHGDLWHPNVLVSPRRWTVIDPWPCAGDPAADAGQWAATTADGAGAETRSAALAAAAGASAARVRAWAVERAAMRVLLIVSHDLAWAPLTGLAGVCDRWLAARP